MSNNTKRLSFFAKIAQRSTALQSLLEEATGKSARDSQGNVIAVEGLHDGHKPFVARPVYATERYQKDIELAQDIPAPPTGPRTAAFGDDESSTIAFRDSTLDASCPSPYKCAWITGNSYFFFATEVESITIGTVAGIIYMGQLYGEATVTAVNVEALLVHYTNGNEVCVRVDETSEEYKAGRYNWSSGDHVFGTDVEFPTTETPLFVWVYIPSPGAWEEVPSEVGYIVEYHREANSSDTSNAISSESINPNTESRVKHVKDFYRGESNWFMGEVGIKNYPFYRHVGWTAPAVTDGTLSATADGYPLNNGSAALGGSTIVFTATPATGKQVASWSGLPAGATTEGNTATFTLTSDVNVSVVIGLPEIDYFCITPVSAENPMKLAFYFEPATPTVTANISGIEGPVNLSKYDGMWWSDDETPYRITDDPVIVGSLVYAEVGEEPVGAVTYVYPDSVRTLEYSTDKVTWHNLPDFIGDVVKATINGTPDVSLYADGGPWYVDDDGTYYQITDDPVTVGSKIYDYDEETLVPTTEVGEVTSIIPQAYQTLTTATYFRGEVREYAGSYNISLAPDSGSINLSGHLSTLVNGTESLTEDLPEGAFTYFFQEWPVVDASELVLPDSHLASTTLGTGVFAGMFMDCDSLTKAPSLPATVLTNGCYSSMFNGCTNLNEVHCDATDISATNCTLNWLSGVAESGDFYGKTAAGWTEGSASGIPSDWDAHLT